MSDEHIHQYAQEKGFHPLTVNRWLSWTVADKEALLALALRIRPGENHVRDLIDWLEEISLRDGLGVRDILATRPISEIETDPRLGRADKLKRIKNQLRRLRFPRLSEIEDRLEAHIRQLKLKPRIRLSVPSGLEGAKLQVELEASTQGELQILIRELAAAAQSASMNEIFALLNGDTTVDGGLKNQS
jgi:hypothetical protein